MKTGTLDAAPILQLSSHAEQSRLHHGARIVEYELLERIHLGGRAFHINKE